MLLVYLITENYFSFNTYSIDRGKTLISLLCFYPGMALALNPRWRMALAFFLPQKIFDQN